MSYGNNLVNVRLMNRDTAGNSCTPFCIDAEPLIRICLARGLVYGLNSGFKLILAFLLGHSLVEKKIGRSEARAVVAFCTKVKFLLHIHR